MPDLQNRRLYRLRALSWSCALLLLEKGTCAHGDATSVRRLGGTRPWWTSRTAASVAAEAAAAALPFLAAPAKMSFLQPTVASTESARAAKTVPVPPFRLPQKTWMPWPQPFSDMQTPAKDPRPGQALEIYSEPRNDTGQAPFQFPTHASRGKEGREASDNAGDETADGALALSLLGLGLWIALSALLVIRFVQSEKRREIMLRFWRAIDANPELRRAVEEEAGGAPLPQYPRRPGLHRFFRACCVALLVTVGLHIVFFVGRTPVPAGEGEGGSEGGGGKGGGGSGGGSGLPLDPTSDDGTAGNNPVVGIVVLSLLLASVILIIRGLYMACCASSSSFPASSAPYGPEGGPARWDTEAGAGVHPVAVTPYVSLHSTGCNSGGWVWGGSPFLGEAQEVYYVGVAVPESTSPRSGQDPGRSGPTAEEAGGEEGAPPPYSSALQTMPESSTSVV